MTQAEVLESPAEVEAPEQEILAEEAGQSEAELLEAPEAADTTPEPEGVDPETQFEEWVSKVSENPNSITSVPTRQHAQIVTAIRDREHAAYQAALDRAYQEALTIGRSQAIAEVWTREKDALLDEGSGTYDPTAFARWQREKPDEFRAYTQLKAAVPQPGQNLDTRVSSIWDELGKFPAAFEAVRAQLQRNGLQKNEQGVAALERMAYEQIGIAKARGSQARQDLDKRAQATEQRRALAKAPAAGSPAGMRISDPVEAARAAAARGEDPVVAAEKAMAAKYGL